MSKSTHNIFHFHDEDRVVDIDASSVSEARRKFKNLWGYFPPGTIETNRTRRVSDKSSISKTTTTTSTGEWSPGHEP